LLIFACVCRVCSGAEPETPVPPAPPTQSTVYYARSDEAIDNYHADPAVVRRLVDELVVAVTGKSDVESAWKSLVNPGDRVGIKIAATGGRYFATHKAVVEAIASGLARAGVPPANIIVWDRADMASAGYRDSGGNYQVRGIESASDYDPQSVVFSPLLGKLIWGDLKFTRQGDQGSVLVRGSEQVSTDSHLCKVMSKEVTKIINVPSMKASESCGVAGCLYNATVPNLDNWRRFVTEPGLGGTAIAELYMDPRISKKIVLNIMDGLVAQYAGERESEPNYAFHYNRIFASKDPVAIDATALREIEKWRKQVKLPSLEKYGTYLQGAEQLGIGNDSEDRIELKAVPSTP